jgi:predicted double-glycine peptidase
MKRVKALLALAAGLLLGFASFGYAQPPASKHSETKIEIIEVLASTMASGAADLISTISNNDITDINGVRHTTFENSGILNIGFVDVNQDTGTGSNQSNVRVLALSGRDGGGQVHENLLTGILTTTNNKVLTIGGERSNTITGSFDGTVGVVGINQSSGSLNHEANLMVMTVGIAYTDTGDLPDVVSVESAALGHVKADNEVDPASAPGDQQHIAIGLNSRGSVMKILRFITAFVTLTALGVGPAGASQFGLPAGSGYLNVRVKSLAELRFKGMIRQAYDVSCGAAALATIMKYYYGAEEMTEQVVIKGMLEIGDKEKIRKFGFSLLELKRFAESRGYLSTGFRMKDVNALSKLKVPAIGLINVRGYKHFVVIRGVSRGQVYVADPAFGNRTKTLPSFDKEWNGVLLLVVDPRNPKPYGNKFFANGQGGNDRLEDVMLTLQHRQIRTTFPGSMPNLVLPGLTEY